MSEVLQHRERTTFRAGALAWYPLLLVVLYAALLFAHPSPPSLGDYGDWTYEGVLLKQHLLGVSDPAHWLKNYPVPNSTTTVGIALLAMLFPWIVAAKIWLCLVLLFGCFAIVRLARAANSPAAVFFIAPTALLFNINFWYGFLNFQISLSIVMLLVAELLRPRRSHWIIGLLLTAAFFTHMLTFSVGGLLLILYAWQTRKPRLLWHLLPGALLTLWYAIARIFFHHNADGQAGMATSVKDYSALFLLFKVNSWFKSFGFVNLGDNTSSVDVYLFGSGVYLALFAVNLLVGTALAWCMIRSFRDAWRRKGDDFFVWLALLILLAAFIVMPGTILGISDPGARLLQCGIAVGLFFCRTPRLSLRLAAAGSFPLALAGLVLFLPAVMGPLTTASRIQHLPAAVTGFAHVPNHDKDSYYDALEKGDMSQPVFPTALLLSRTAAVPPAVIPHP